MRSDIHSLQLDNRNNLWYQGGGAYQAWTFGYVGRPSNRQSSLATLYDASADFNVNAHHSVGAYYAPGRREIRHRATYPQCKNANYGYLEVMTKF